MRHAFLATLIAAMLRTTHENVPMGYTYECAHGFHSLKQAYDVCP